MKSANLVITGMERNFSHLPRFLRAVNHLPPGKQYSLLSRAEGSREAVPFSPDSQAISLEHLGGKEIFEKGNTWSLFAAQLLVNFVIGLDRIQSDGLPDSGLNGMQMLDRLIDLHKDKLIGLDGSVSFRNVVQLLYEDMLYGNPVQAGAFWEADTPFLGDYRGYGYSGPSCTSKFYLQIAGWLRDYVQGMPMPWRGGRAIHDPKVFEKRSKLGRVPVTASLAQMLFFVYDDIYRSHALRRPTQTDVSSPIPLPSIFGLALPRGYRAMVGGNVGGIEPVVVEILRTPQTFAPYWRLSGLRRGGPGTNCTHGCEPGDISLDRGKYVLLTNAKDPTIVTD